MATASESSLTVFTGSYWNALSLSNMVYDWLISLDDELALIWDPQDRRIGATVVYAMTRYGTIAQYAFPIVPFDSYPQLVVNGLGTHADNWATPASCIDRSPGAAEVNFMCGRLPMWVASHFAPPAMAERWSLAPVTITARGCAILADLIVVLVTWRHARETVCLSRGVSIGPTYARVFLHDGSLYFVSSTSVLATFNMVRIVLSAYEFTVPLSNDQPASIIVSRFILNLRAVHRNLSTVSRVSCVRFQPHAQSAPDDGRLSGLAVSFSGLMCEEVDVPTEEFTNDPAADVLS
ncbi:hypothetical protein C8Q80DRAFT_1267885 [Daedaleopsis nitida]|nr:hypothetical protein C8Q80DRAFT_1267885 [Daedaleopsis nitida]